MTFDRKAYGARYQVENIDRIRPQKRAWYLRKKAETALACDAILWEYLKDVRRLPA